MTKYPNYSHQMLRLPSSINKLARVFLSLVQEIRLKRFSFVRLEKRRKKTSFLGLDRKEFALPSFLGSRRRENNCCHVYEKL